MAFAVDEDEGESMTASHIVGGRAVARNTVLNFFGQAVPLVVGFVALPFTVRGLGPDRFGILSLSWAVLGYFSLFDFGLSRATTKFVAEALGKGEHIRLRGLIWTSLSFHVVLGVVGGILLAASTPLLVEHLLKIPLALRQDARVTLLLMSASVPVVVAAAGLRGVLEGGQHFGLANAVKIPTTSLTYIIPAVGPPLGWGLPEVVLFMLLAKIVAAGGYFLLCLKLVPSLKSGFLMNRSELRALVGFGGWVAVSNTIGPVLMYVDRFVIGSVLSMTAVAHYVAPYEAVTKLWILPTSAATTLLPVFSTVGTSDRASVERLFASGAKFVLVAITPIVMATLMLGREILMMWLGADYAAHSTLVLQILSVGILVHSLGYVPWSLLQAYGRPDLTSKFHMAHVLPYLAVMWVLVHRMGITGAALAWAVRGCADGVFHFCAGYRLGHLSREVFRGRALGSALWIVAGILAGLSCAAVLTDDVLLKVLTLTASLVLFATAIWRYALDQGERKMVASLLRTGGWPRNEPAVRR